MSKSKNKQKYKPQEIFEDMNKILEALNKFEVKIESTDQIKDHKKNLESISKNILKKYNKENLDIEK